MNYKKVFAETCFFIFLLGVVVGLSYRVTPYLFNIQYQSQERPDEDGIEKVIVSHITGVRKCTTNNFSYNMERERYEYVISEDENTYLNLYLNPLQTFRCDLEYRLKYEDSRVAQSDAIVATIYKGNNPIHQQIFPLFERNTTWEYQPELYIKQFIIMFFGSFLLSIICISQIVFKRQIYRLISESMITAIWCVNWFCGMKWNAFIEKDVFYKFALAFFILVALFAMAVAYWGNVPKGEERTFIISTVKRIFIPILFLVTTCCIYIPSSLFIGNMDEFVMPYYRIAGLIFLYAFILLIVFLAIGICIRSVGIQYIYSIILFFVTIGFYIQSNFLNPKIPDLDGEKIDWNQFDVAKMYSYIGWGCVLLLLLIVIGLFIWKNIKIEKVICYISGMLILMQVCSLTVIAITNKVDSELCRACGKEGQFTVGDDNIIIFLVDCLQVDAVQNYLVNEKDAENSLQDFTLFVDTIGGGAPTEYAIPLILTGEEYDPSQDINEYYKEIWQEGYMLADLRAEGYDTRIYTEAELVKGVPTEQVQNIYETDGNKIENKKLFLKKIIQLANLYMMPLPLKGYFELNTEELKDCLTVVSKGETCNEEAYNMGNVNFYEELQLNQLHKEKGKTFRFYHLRGVHRPFKNDENLKRTAYNGTNEERTFQGVMVLIQEYINEMKTLGIYDNSTFIILGDHGRHNSEDKERYPAILVKRAGEHHPLQYSENPVCFRNLVATIGSEIKEDYAQYGPNLFDIDKTSDIERLQTLNRQTAMEYAQYSGSLYADSETGARFIVVDEGGELTYQEWNPYEINRIHYNYGDIIDFSLSDIYTDNLTQRLYSVQGGKTASNELTICFDVSKQKIPKDLEFGFTYSNVYNDMQKMRVYVNGNKVGNVMCTKQGIGEENVLVIPKQIVKDKPIIVRIVFPNAVTPNQLDSANLDKRVLSVTFHKLWMKVAN